MLKSRIYSGLFILLVYSFTTIITSCTDKEEIPIFSFRIENTTETNYKDQVLLLDTPELLKILNSIPHESIVVKSGNSILYHQAKIDSKSKTINGLLVLLDIDKDTSEQVDIFSDKLAENNFTKRTQAELSVKEGGVWKQVTKKSGVTQFEYEGGEFQKTKYLRVPDEHTDHSFYIRYEGPGWESDKVGYRFYLDWRNAVDIFGKTTDDMILHEVGLDGFDSYHEQNDWGMDILKVGSSLGIGSIGYWSKDKAMRVEKTDSIICSIIQDGVIQSSISTLYYGWQVADKKVDLISNISINAGSRLTHQQVELSEGIENICTGIVKNELAELIVSDKDSGEWGYIATFGKQSLNNDNLGMIIFYRLGNLIKIAEDENSHIVVLHPESNAIDYYFGATWEQDLDSIDTLNKFLTYADKTLFQLNNPLSIKASIE